MALILNKILPYRSQSVDRNKEKPTTRTAQRLLSPFGASVMRRVRSVRKSVQKVCFNSGIYVLSVSI
jgi:hypothetical protein